MSEGRHFFWGGISLSCGYSLMQPAWIDTVLLAVTGTLVSFLTSRLLGCIGAKKNRRDKGV